MGVMLSAGGSYDWFCRNLMPDIMAQEQEDGRDPFEAITEEASRIQPGAGGLMFLPYLTGERTPHVDPNARGSFVGLTPHHGRAHLARAVIEGARTVEDAVVVVESANVEVECGTRDADDG